MGLSALEVGLASVRRNVGFGIVSICDYYIVKHLSAFSLAFGIHYRHLIEMR